MNGEAARVQGQEKFYLVKETILPEAIKKTIKIKELLLAGGAKTINEAADKIKLSRSAYYKYKDCVLPFFDASREKIVSLSILLEHKPGALSGVLNAVAADLGSVITINQSIPSHGVANINLTMETANLKLELEALLDKIRTLDGVKKLEVLGYI
ncbi:MAG: ACT domain-containing protein [Acidaminococcales bacterium]|jgi:chorismate mutase|nr:ACT domain-containing protein [Acidaminococcales bacterium]